MSNVYSVGVIGCGIGGGLHINGYQPSPRFDLKSVCDLSADATAKWVEKFPELNAYADYHAMLASESLDVVSVATYAPTHEMMVAAALEAGAKGVVCEKPIALEAPAGRRIIAMCKEAGVPLVTPHQFRTLGHALALRALVGDGAIGTPYLAEMRVKGWDLINAGVHMINALGFVTGDPMATRVMGQMDCTKQVVRDGIQVENFGVTNIEYANGMRCVLETGDDVEFPDGRDKGMILYGSEGRVEFDLWSPEIILFNGENPGGLSDKPAVPEGHVTGHRGIFEMLAAQLDSGECDYGLPESALAAVEVINASYLSAQLGQTMSVPVDETLKMSGWAGVPA